MKRSTVISMGICIVSCLTSTIAADDFDRLAAAVSATEGHSANFTQTFRPHGSEEGLVESGTVIFGVLPQMRWTYDEPEKKVFVFDGETSWLYVPADRQVSVHRLTGSERNALPFLVLKEEGKARQSFEISSSKIDGTVRLMLTPKESTPIQSLVVSYDSENRRINSIEYEDAEGNVTRFSLHNFRRVDHRPATFRLEVPSGVEVVEY
ncbi:MAG: outer membrane lipoprotein carrier protein LolA [Thermoanaerobaculia bacterium]|nr:outer membrane lipoprotein carrier protein LolA [Thermoanaerobaculia bacterium]